MPKILLVVESGDGSVLCTNVTQGTHQWLGVNANELLAFNKGDQIILQAYGNTGWVFSWYKIGKATVTTNPYTSNFYTDDIEVDVGFVQAAVAPAPPTTTPPAPSGGGGGGAGEVWVVGTASPNDSSRQFLGKQYNSQQACIRAWQGAGNSGDGGCRLVSSAAGGGGATGGVSQDVVMKLISSAVSAIQSLIDGFDTRLHSVTATIEDIVTKAEEEAKAWRDALAAGITALRTDITNAITAAVNTVDASIADVVQHAEDEAKAWRAAVQNVWDTLDTWLVDRILVILEKALDNEVRK